jgi:TetR/AcrR family transcriptional regulator, regulator of autoinduction and epiphytic fitness
MNLTERKNKQIVEAAILEFQERGFAGASMDRISDRAQVSKRTVYNHFESKEALFKAIIDCLFERLRSSMEITFNADAPIREELVRLGWKQGNIFMNPSEMSMARMMLGEIIRDPGLAATMNNRFDTVRIVARFLDEAVQSGKLDIADTWVAADQFLGLIKVRGFFPKLFGEELSTKEEMATIIDESVDMFLKSYGAEGQQQKREVA